MRWLAATSCAVALLAGCSSSRARQVADPPEQEAASPEARAGAPAGGGAGDAGRVASDAPAVPPDQVLLLTEGQETIVEACAEWALTICQRVQQCGFGAYFNLGTCTAAEALACHAHLGLPGSSLTVERLPECARDLLSWDCVRFAGAARIRRQATTGHRTLIERCLEPRAGSLDNGEVCQQYHQCRSATCASFTSPDRLQCYRCVDDLLRPRGGEFADGLPAMEADGDPATGGECNNSLLEPVDGVCRLRPPDELDLNCGCPDGQRCAGGNCIEPRRLGESCQASSVGEFHVPCEHGTVCEPDGPIGDLGFVGTCGRPMHFGDEPAAVEYRPRYTSRECAEQRLDRADVEVDQSPRIGLDCSPAVEDAPSYLGARVGQTHVFRDRYSGACAVHRFQGRTTCPYGQTVAGGGCTTPRGLPVEGPVAPQLLARRPDSAPQPSVYSTCRCGGDDPTAAYCACPEKFQCVRIGEDFNASGWADFCLREDTEALDPAALASAERCDPVQLTCGEP